MKKVIPEGAHLIPDIAKKMFTGAIFDVYQWPQKMFDGSTATFEMLKRPDTVIVIPLIDDKILIIEDEQPHTGKKQGFPGGRVDNSDASTLDAAKREMLEETGYKFDSWKLVNAMQPHFKLEWFTYSYIAWDAHKVTEPHLDAGEKITIKKLNFDESKAFVVTKSTMGEAGDIFDEANSVEELKNLPEFKGQEIEDKKVK